MGKIDGRAVAILLLTGGHSRRFGDGAKLQAEIGEGVRVIDLVVANLSKVGLPIFEAGVGLTDLPKVQGTQYKSPLVGVARGYEKISAEFGTSETSILVVAGDMVALDAPTLSVIGSFPSSRSVVPFDGTLQILGARWSRTSLKMAQFMAETHPSFSLRGALGEGVIVLDDRRWRGDSSPFFDIDTYDDLRRFRRNFLGSIDAP